MPKWFICPQGRGKLHENGAPTERLSHFHENSVGLLKEIKNGHAILWLIGRDEIYTVSEHEIIEIDVTKTGDKHDKKICNICHCLKLVKEFSINQNNLHGRLRRPSCNLCRVGIDKKAPKSDQAKRKEKERPQKGNPFKCPICQKRSIAGITAKIVADHDHNTGNIRDFICDSCNTGLGRFKNGKDYLMNAVQYLKERDELQ